MQKWLLWTEHQYRLPPAGKAFQELGGKELCAMSEEQFRQRAPLGGDVLHAHLDIWKSGESLPAPGHCGNQASLGFASASLPLPPKCWPGRHGTPHSALTSLLKGKLFLRLGLFFY